MKNNANTIVIAFAIIATALIFAHAFTNRNSAGDTISVTGLGSKDFSSDLVVWSGSFIRKGFTLKEVYSELDGDRERIKAYLLAKGVKAEQIVFSAIKIDKEFDDTYDNFGNKTKTVFTGYRLSQAITLESNEVDKIESISRQVSELIHSGVEFESNEPQYYYTKLAALKIEMIAEATKDANIRANRIAENASSKVGKLKKADMGVFQIVAQNSSEEYSWGGQYNTSSKRKTASITVKLSYEVE